MRAASRPSRRRSARVPCSVLLLSALLLCSACLLRAKASVASKQLLEARAGSTFEYTMYDGAEVTGELFFSGLTTYPYVFDSAMNTFIVELLNGYLTQQKKSLESVGGTLQACMGVGGISSTGVKCYKALLAAAAPADCPAANVLCCPLFWRVGGQNIETTMAEVDPHTVFWNGRYAINGFFANFSDTYLLDHDNCTVPIFNATNKISLAVDVTGEWRFVELQTTYVLKETAMSVLPAAAAPYFNNENPQDAIAAANKAQKPIYKSLSSVAAPVAVTIVLLVLIGLFLLLTFLCSVRRTAKGVRERQRCVLDLASKPQPSAARAVLDEISSESSSSSGDSSSSAESRRQLNLTRHSSRYNMIATSSDDDDDEEEESESDDESYAEDAEEHHQLTKAASAHSKSSAKSATSKASSKRGRKKKPQSVEDFPSRPAALPGIGAHRGSQDSPEAASASPNVNPLQPEKRTSSTGTVVHHLNAPQQAGQSQQREAPEKREEQDMWFNS